MRIVTILSLLLLTSAAYGELTKADLHDLKEDLHKVIKEEITASEKRTREHIDLKIDAVNTRIDALDQKVDDLSKSLNGRIDDTRTIMIALIALIAAAIAVPQIIMAYKERGQQGMQTQIDQLRAQIESMQNTPS